MIKEKTRLKKIPISDKLATDAAGVAALKELHEKLERHPHYPKQQRYYAVVNLLKSLQVERRLWRISDGSLVE